MEVLVRICKVQVRSCWKYTAVRTNFPQDAFELLIVRIAADAADPEADASNEDFEEPHVAIGNHGDRVCCASTTVTEISHRESRTSDVFLLAAHQHSDVTRCVSCGGRSACIVGTVASGSSTRSRIGSSSSRSSATNLDSRFQKPRNETERGKESHVPKTT